jgi:bla regulator protein BlaR1
VWATGWIRVSRMVRRAMPLGQGPEVEALRRLESSFGVRKPIKLVLSRNWMEPGIFGVIRPVLIWPEGISQHLDDRHVEAILAHEICHACRHDNLTAILHMLVEAVFWFHPLVWWMGARLEEERERACDEEVSLLCNQPHVYAESILRVCKFCSESPLACVSGITGADLKRRIVQIMTERVVRKLDPGRKLLLLAVGLTVLAVPIVLGQVKAAQRMMLAAAATPSVGWPSVGQAAPDAASIPASSAGAKVVAFDVISAKPNKSGGPTMLRMTPDGFTMVNMPVDILLTQGFLVGPNQIVGEPGWAKSDRWNVDAKVAGEDVAALGKLTFDQRRAMYRQVLEDSFGMKVHRETRELPVYALVVAKGGPKIKESKPDLDAEAGGKNLPRITPGPRDGDLSGQNVSMNFLASNLSLYVDRTVIDNTGLTGRYDFAISWAGGKDTDSGPAIFTVIQEQLGLKLVPTKAPVEVVVIDHIEKPTVDGAEVPTTVPMGVAPVAPAAMVQEKAASTPTAPEHAIKFDVVSIRQNKSGSREMMRQSAADTDSITMTNVPLALVVFYAYWINDPNMITGVPDWAMTERYDVVAKVAPSDLAAYHALPNRQRAAMLQAVLTDRFKLQVHHETKDSPVYTLVVAKGGPKLKEAQPGEAHPDTAKANPNAFQHGATIFATGSNQITGEAAKMGDLAVSLSTRGFEALGLGRPVIDKTGLTGRYDFVLQFPLPGANAASTEVEDAPQESAASLSNALQDQLGLKLQSATAPTDYLVIDHVERPSAN